MAKRKVIGAKGKGFLGNGSGAACSPTFAERETLKKEKCPFRYFFLLLGYHKCIATPISHA